MSLAISKYKKTIQDIKVLHNMDYEYDTKQWSKLNKVAKSLVSVHENDSISRKDVINAFQKYYNEDSNVLYPFILTMIWGFGTNGYGTYRTNSYLSSSENKKSIKFAFDALKFGDQKDAFTHLMKIKGLNISYVSKLLYFATRALNHKDYALIFDIRVARSLVNILNSDGIEGMLEIYPSKKYKDYVNYNMLMHKWARELNVEAENIEVFLFNGDL